MQSLSTIVSILLPLFIGFCLKIPTIHLKWVDKFLSYWVYVILLLIGMGLAQTENLFRELNHIVFDAIFLFVLLMLCNIVALLALDTYRQGQRIQAATTVRGRFNFSDSIKQIGVLMFGTFLGAVLPEMLLPSDNAGLYALMLLIFAVGILLRGNGITLKQILLNQYGMQISMVMMLSSAFAGLIFAFCVDGVSWSQGLALSSGYGWYSLSGIVMTQAYGANWGSVAVLNDLLREFFALAFIPALMRRSAAAAIGVGGATSLDFTLPIIQKSGGLAAVPIAIGFGFIVNVAAPFLMVFFVAQ